MKNAISKIEPSLTLFFYSNVPSFKIFQNENFNW